MCLILFAVNPNEEYSLVLAANRDELYARPTTDAQYWEDFPDVLAGRDDDMGGTWLGISRKGRFAAVTNFRENLTNPPPLSRGELTSDFLTSDELPEAYLQSITTKQDEFKGFNLLIADTSGCYYFSNRTGEAPRKLGDGYYGLSNQLLDCDWPKVNEGKDKLKTLIHSEADLTESLFQLLTSNGDQREFSNSFIVGDVYGTRAATVVTVKREGEVHFEERNFVAEGLADTQNAYQFSL